MARLENIRVKSSTKTTSLKITHSGPVILLALNTLLILGLYVLQFRK